ncbi:MAG: hypothetical protein GTO12_07210 [Proteobacteria bacterium]|nr:hypothetical protein [Pseudomonadota bacterium]
MKQTQSHWLIEFANRWKDALESPSREVEKTVIFSKEVHRVLEAAAHTLRHQREYPDNQSNYTHERFDPTFFAHIEEARAHMKPRFIVPGLEETRHGNNDLDSCARLEWEPDLGEVHRGTMTWYYLQVANFLSQPDLVVALRQCPWCERLFLSTHKTKKYCSHKCKANDEYERRYGKIRKKRWRVRGAGVFETVKTENRTKKEGPHITAK